MTHILPTLVALLAIQAAVSIGSIAGPVLAPLVADHLGVEPYLVGLYVAATYGAAAVAGLMSGGMIVRYGAIRTCQACLVLTALSLALGALGSLWALPAAALAMGAGYGPTTPASSHILARLTPPHLVNFVFSLKQTGVPLGNALGGALLPAAALALGWQGAALAVALICLALALAVQPLRPTLDADRQSGRAALSRSHATTALRLVWESRPIRMLALISLTYSGMQVSLSAFLVTYLHDDLALGLVTAGFLLTASQLAGVGGRLLWGVTADRFAAPLKILGLLGLGMSAAALVTASFTPGWPLAAMLAVCVAFGGTATAWNGVYLAQVARLSPPGRAGEMTGGTSFFTFGGVMLMPTLFSALLAASNSYTLAFSTIAVATLASGIALLLQGRELAAPDPGA